MRFPPPTLPVFPRFYDRFEVDGDRYIVIEYVEGKPLDKVFSEEYPTERGIDSSELIALGLETRDPAKSFMRSEVA